MAKMLERSEQRCRCKHGCPTSATLQRWSCGCRTVEIHNDRERGSDCTNFSAMKQYCGKSGWPDNH